MKSLTHDEVLKVLKAAADNKRNLAMTCLGFKHGMRASEVCGLELKDLDLKNGEITIRRLKGSLKTTQPLADIQGQPLLSEKRVLRAWLEERGNHWFRQLDLAPFDLLFWPHLLVNPLSAPSRSEALRRP